MANRDIIVRMEAILDEYEAGRVSALDVERSIQSHIEALEALPYSRIKDADYLCSRLVKALPTGEASEFLGGEDAATVLADLRKFLASLPRGSAE
jgi:hypothetical protein